MRPCGRDVALPFVDFMSEGKGPFSILLLHKLNPTAM